MNGYLKIKTRLDNKEIDKDITELENKIKKLQEDNSKTSTEQSSLQQEIDNYKELQAEADAYKNEIKKLQLEKEKMFKANPELAVSVDTPEYANVKAQIAEMQNKYAQVNKEIDKQAPKIDKVYQKLDKIKAKQTENNAKVSEYKSKIESIKTDKIKSGIDNVGKSLENQIGKIGKMAMAVVGIRTAWMGVRRIVSTVSQYNNQVSTDLNYMGYVVSNVFAPAVKGLINLFYTLLSYVNAISKAWFGVNLFSGASVKNFKKMQSSAGGTAKSAKEIQKSLQGFDEMNVLSDTSNDSSGGGASVSTPSMDLSGMQAEIPGWLQWIIDNKELILGIIAGITAGLISMKLLGLDPLMSLGIGLVIAGVVEAIQGLIKFIKDPTWENFIPILEGIAIALTGIGVIIGVLTGNWIPLIIAVVALVVAEIIKYWDSIKEVLSIVGQWIYDNVIKPVGDFFSSLWDKIKEIFKPFIDFFKSIFSTAYENIKITIDNLKQIFSVLWNAIKTIFSPVAEFFKNIFTNAYNAIKKVFSSIGTFFSGIWNKIKGIFANIGQKIGNAVSSAFKSAVNAVLSTIERVLNTPIKAINGLIGVINLVPGINLTKLKTFSLPRLAKGGIISQPTQAIIGEAGKEAVMPLENNLEWLDILADKLASRMGNNGGSYIIQLNGRTIQRGIAKQQQELAFAMNGG